MLSDVFSAPVTGAYHLVIALTGAVGPLLGEAGTAAAIILFTVGVRCLLLPFSHAQFRGERARNRILPKLRELQQWHRDDPQRLRREMSALQRAEGASVFSGCLPSLVQLPFFSVMYRLFTSTIVGG
jgi:YidC/Oxa1 family membrane protein insertase